MKYICVQDKAFKPNVSYNLFGVPTFVSVLPLVHYCGKPLLVTVHCEEINVATFGNYK
jgi:hypothetical protein